MALNPDMQEILTETRAGDSILEADNYPDVYKQLQGEVDTDSENILAAWLGDIDANVLTQSDGYTSDSSFDITQRSWIRLRRPASRCSQRHIPMPVPEK